MLSSTKNSTMIAIGEYRVVRNQDDLLVAVASQNVLNVLQDLDGVFVFAPGFQSGFVPGMKHPL